MDTHEQTITITATVPDPVTLAAEIRVSTWRMMTPPPPSPPPMTDDEVRAALDLGEA